MSLPHDLGHGLLQLLYPNTCVVCAQALADDPDHFCPGCRAALTTDPHLSCPRCASTVGPFVNLDGGCVHCRDDSFQFEKTLRLGPYEGLLREVVLRAKQASGEGLAEAVGLLWAEHSGPRLRELGAAVVVPVPLHWWRRWQRGYNQSEILARSLAARLGLNCELRLRRVRATPQQTLQPPTGRRQNVRGAFQARRGSSLHGKTVLLVDDVLTTGSTCSEAARALRDAGAARVVVAVLAKSQS